MHGDGRPSLAKRAAPALPLEVLAALALACAFVLLVRLNHDTAWCFAAARRLLGGERMYVDILEVNPPLIFWLMAPAAWLGQALGIPDGPAAYLLHALSLVAATLSAARVLALEPAPQRWIRSSFLCAFVFLATVPSVHDLGQRDLLAGILLFPYVLLAARAAQARPAPLGLSIACGVLGAVGVALKPFFVIPWLAVELVVLWRRRSLRALWRIDVALVALGQVVYAALVLAVTPEYVSRIVPLASATYSAFNASRLEMVTRWVVPALWLCGLGALAVRRRLLPGALLLPPVESLLAAALGFFASYVVQGKGFGYHLLPVLVLAAPALLSPTLGALILFAQSRRGDGAQRRQALRAVLACAVSGSLVALFLARELHTAFVWIRAGYPPEVRELAKLAPRGQPIFVLSTSEWPGFPAANLSGARWPYHFNHLWPLPAFYRAGSDGGYHAPEAQGPIERSFFTTVVGDLVATPPRVLAIDREPPELPRGFDLLSYFSASPAFAELMRGYRPAENVGRFEILVHR